MILFGQVRMRGKKAISYKKRYEISMTFIANCDKEKYDDKHVY